MRRRRAGQSESWCHPARLAALCPAEGARCPPADAADARRCGVRHQSQDIHREYPALNVFVDPDSEPGWGTPTAAKTWRLPVLPIVL